MSITEQLEAERRIINAAKRHCDLPLEFQQWGPQNQNGDDAESILFDANGESLAYGLPDEIGELAVLASTALPLRSAQVAAVWSKLESLDSLAQIEPDDDDYSKGINIAASIIRRAVEEAGA